MTRIRLKPSDAEYASLLLGMLARRDWPALRAAISGQLAETAYTLLRLMSEQAPADADVGYLIREGDTLSLTVAGALLHGRALRFRGLDDAESVSEEQWELYIPTLHHAQELLQRATMCDPSSGLAAAWAMTVSVDATDHEKDEAEAALAAAKDVPVSGWSRLLSARSQKWGGSHEAMWRIARTYADRDSPGTLALVAKAHYEQKLWYERFEEDPRLVALAQDYFGRPEVRAELASASARTLALSHADPRNTLCADNWFAWVFWTGGDKKAARPHLRRMGGHVDPTVWLLPKPGLWLNLARLQARLLPVFG